MFSEEDLEGGLVELYMYRKFGCLVWYKKDVGIDR